MADVNINPAKVHSKNGTGHLEETVQPVAKLHPAWLAMIRFCREMGYGEIACLKIHGGIPISAEVVTKKIRWY